MCPAQELNLQPFSAQDYAITSGLHQPGTKEHSLKNTYPENNLKGEKKVEDCNSL